MRMNLNIARMGRIKQTFPAHGHQLPLPVPYRNQQFVEQ